MSKENFKNNAKAVVSALSKYLDQCEEPSSPVIHQRPIFDILNKLNVEELIKTGDLDGPKLEKFTTDYLDETTKLHNPHYMAHQVSVPHTTGALGSFIDGLTNNAMAIYEMGPAATAIEYFMINWMLGKIGWKQAPIPGKPDDTTTNSHGSGVMTHGGSLANLTALVAARSAKFPNIWRDGNPGNIVVLVPEQSHYSLKRTVGIIGLGENNCISMPADEDGRVMAEKIPELIEKLKNDGKQIMAIVGNACGTAAGL